MKLTKENLEKQSVGCYALFCDGEFIHSFEKKNKFCAAESECDVDGYEFFPVSAIKMPKEENPHEYHNPEDKDTNVIPTGKQYLYTPDVAALEQRIEKIEKYLDCNNPQNPKTLAYQLLSMRKDVDALINKNGEKPHPNIAKPPLQTQEKPLYTESNIKGLTVKADFLEEELLILNADNDWVTFRDNLCYETKQFLHWLNSGEIKVVSGVEKYADKPEKIVCAAVKYFYDSPIYPFLRVVAGVDYNSINMPTELLGCEGIHTTKGFLTSKNRFVGNAEALSIAEKAGQIKSSACKFELRPEDLL